MFRFSLLLIFSFSLLSAEPLPLRVKADTAILINADTGAILYEKNSHKSMDPASVTKIATALYALNLKKDLNERVLITKEMTASTTEEAKKKSGYKLPAHLQEPGGTHIGLKVDEIVPLKDLLYGLMLASGNDAANAIAFQCGGTMDNFMANLNVHLQKIGCTQTHFANPHGLYYPTHKTTAYDLAVMTREALKNPIFKQIVATTSYTKGQTNLQPPFTFAQSNKLLRNGPYYYPKAIGVKTGYIRASGHNLVSAATQDGRTLIAVVMNCKEGKDKFIESKKMFETAFAEKKVERTVFDKGPQKFELAIPGAQKPVKGQLDSALSYKCYPSEEPEFKCLLVWDEVSLPVNQGQRIGELRLALADGKVIAHANLVAQEDVEASFSHKLKTSIVDLWTLHPALMLITIILFCVIVYYAFRRLFV